MMELFVEMEPCVHGGWQLIMEHCQLMFLLLLIDEGTAQCERMEADDGNALCGDGAEYITVTDEGTGQCEMMQLMMELF